MRIGGDLGEILFYKELMNIHGETICQFINSLDCVVYFTCQ